MKKVIIIGAGGHGKVIADIVLKSGDEVLGFLDDKISKGTKILGFPVLGNIEDGKNFDSDCFFLIAIGDIAIREKISQQLDFKWYIAVHPDASIGEDVSISSGTCIMAKAVVNVSSEIGEHCIINSGAIVEHDCRVGNYSHIATGSVLGGTVTIGKNVLLGSHSTVRNNLMIADKTIIGSGGVVIEDIKNHGVYVGVPVRKRKSIE